ncbi:MAG: hypothetical protein WKF88_05545 [Ferruginibacter sp.]
MKQFFTFFLLLCSAGFCAAQSISSDKIDIEIANQPKMPTEPGSRFYRVKVNSPYNLTAEDINRQSKGAYEKALKGYDNEVIQSEKDYEKKLKSYDADVLKAKEKFAIENEAFKKMSLLERLATTEQGKAPKLVIPSKPEYYKPAPPEYREPDLKDYFIVNNDVLAGQISLAGFERGQAYIDINVDLAAVNFQDNAGQTFANQPTRLVVKVNGIEKTNISLFEKFEFISSSPTNNINKAQEERNYINKVIAYLNKYLNEQYGYQAVKETVKIEYVKNKGDYDDLEKAHIYVTTNLKKLSSSSDPEVRESALANMQKGLDIWLQTLAKVQYRDPKAVFNYKIARYIYFDLIKVNLILGNKKEAEKYLNALQENLVDIKLSSDEKEELKSFEKRIYKK